MAASVWLRRALWSLLIVGAGFGGYLLNQWWPLQAEATSAAVTIQSDPAGAEIFLDAARHGTTPLTLALPDGDYVFDVIYQGRRKPLTIAARAGATVVHHVEFESSATPAPTAALKIITEPAKLRVMVDGVVRGVSPLTLTDLGAGAHDVKVTGPTGSFARRVELAAGENASVILSATAAAPAGPAAGWLTVTSAFPVQILEGRDVVGTSQSQRIMLPAGKHELRLTNEALGFSQNRMVQVVPGKTATLAVERPRAPLSINAVPWANVWIDGKRVGETPIGNHLVGIGAGEIVFRHPEFGERRQTVTVSLSAPARVSVDMRKSQQ